MADFYSRLIADPRKAIDAASVTRVDELGNGYDDNSDSRPALLAAIRKRMQGDQ